MTTSDPETLTRQERRILAYLRDEPNGMLDAVIKLGRAVDEGDAPTMVGAVRRLHKILDNMITALDREAAAVKEAKR
jgi:hypothetical protein